MVGLGGIEPPSHHYQRWILADKLQPRLIFIYIGYEIKTILILL
ncbi:hypothetical protein GvMRE_I1g255 [endosymbiont GvMRE of Glomus versiforme]|nr:hypothetical protein GvMRE_I1g255 [endosymbiont GvMRE of Glomus versiforme]